MATREGDCPEFPQESLRKMQLQNGAGRPNVENFLRSYRAISAGPAPPTPTPTEPPLRRREVGAYKVQAYPREWGWQEGTSPKAFPPQKSSLKQGI